jgi:hypothetical protein
VLESANEMVVDIQQDGDDDDDDDDEPVPGTAGESKRDM